MGALLMRLMIFASIAFSLGCQRCLGVRMEVHIKKPHLNADHVPNCVTSALLGDPLSARILCGNENREWIEIAAENGDAVESHNMGVLFYNTYDAVGAARSLFWYIRAKEMGYELDPEDITRLTDRLNRLVGTGFREKYKYSKKLSHQDLELSAMLGDAISASELVDIYRLNEPLRLSWSRIACQNGSVDEAYKYGIFLVQSGDKSKTFRGYFWLRKAAFKSHRDAIAALTKVDDALPDTWGGNTGF